MDSTVLITQTALELLQQQKPFVLASITSQMGSAPRTAGARMLIDLEGSIYGTIGGGLLEAKVMQAAPEVLATQQSIFMFFNLKAQDISGIDMICGGNAMVLLDPVYPTTENLKVFEAWHKAAETNSAAFLTVVESEGHNFTVKGHGLLSHDGSFFGTYDLNQLELMQILQTAKNSKNTQILKLSEKNNVVVDPINMPKTLYCFGGGHVAKPTAHIANLVGFEVVIIDDRPEFANKERFPEAKSTIVSDFNSAFSKITVDENSYIVIFTRGHLHDLTVLEEALKTKACYIGMIGSKTKRDRIYQELLHNNVASQADIQRVYSPIGLEIDAQTPEEIGVSIAAQLIKVRANIK